MERIFVDTNIVMDLLQKREPFYTEAQELFTLSDKKEIKLYISALTFANTHYLISRHHSTSETRKILSKFKILADVLSLDDKIIGLSLVSDFKDFEDAIQYFTAVENNMDVIITRNKRDFKNSVLPLLSAGEYLKR